MRWSVCAPVFVAGVAACAQPEPEDTNAPASAPYAWDYQPEGGTEAPSVETLTAALQGAVDRARVFHAGPILAGYEAAMVGEGSVCPTWYRMGEYHYWYDDCASETGDRYNGYTFVTELADNTDYVRDGIAVWGSSTVTMADGRVLHVGGRLEQAHAVGQGQQVWSSRVKGTFRWDGAESDGTWLAEGYELDLELLGMTYADGTDGRGFQLDGGIDGFGGPFDTLRFESVNLSKPDGALADGCVLEPAGTIAARDATGAWYEVTFEMVVGGELTDLAQCDGCGAASRQGEDLGQVCLDFAPLVDWDLAGPW